MLRYSFKDQVVVITGAGGNLGTSVTRQFLSAGANLVLIEYSQEKLTHLFTEIDQLDRHIIAQGVDINEPEALESVITNAMNKFGRIDVLVNTIGGYRGGSPLHETTNDVWNLLFEMNVNSVFNLAKAVVPIMKKAQFGKIVNVSARLGLKGSANNAAYSAAKSAVIRLTESMAAELIDDGINVNCILPGTIDTPQNRAERPNADYSRWVSPDAIAEVIIFLASKSAQAVSGVCIPVYGRS